MRLPARHKHIAAVVVAGSAAALLVGSALVGCGDDGGEGSGGTATVQADEGVTVVGGEYFFDPETLVVQGGEGPLELTLDNQGDVAHNLTVFDGETELGATPTFAGGESQSAEVELGPGNYRMVCTVGDHEALGMVGELEVRP